MRGKSKKKMWGGGVIEIEKQAHTRYLQQHFMKQIFMNDNLKCLTCCDTEEKKTMAHVLKTELHIF